MNIRNCLFLLATAGLFCAVAAAPVVFILGDHIALSRAEFWRLGFGPTVVAFGLLLAIASLMAYRRSEAAQLVCELWPGLFSIAFGILLVARFSGGYSETIVMSLAASTFWFAAMRRPHVKRIS